MRRWPSWPQSLDRARAPPARPLAVDPRGRRRLLQRLRAGDPRAQQRLLRPGALRPALRRLAAPRRRAAGHRPRDQEHARGAGAHLCRHARPQMGGGGRRLRARRRRVRRQLRRAGPVSAVIPVDLRIRAARPAPIDLLKGLAGLLDADKSRRVLANGYWRVRSSGDGQQGWAVETHRYSLSAVSAYSGHSGLYGSCSSSSSFTAVRARCGDTAMGLP